MERHNNVKIAIFSGEIPSTTFIEHFIKGVSKHHKVLLFGVTKSKIAYQNKNIKIYSTPTAHLKNLMISGYRTIKLGVTNFKELVRLINHVKTYKSWYDRWIWYTKCLPILVYKPDVLHLQWTRDLEFYTFLKTKFNIPLLVSLRGAHINYTPIIEPRMAEVYKQSFSKVDAFHAVSLAIAQEALKYGEVEAKTTVIHSPIPDMFLKAFSPINKRQSKRIHLVSVGRFHWIKGYRYAIDAIAVLKSKGYDVQYTIVGPNTLTEALAHQIHELALKQEIILAGNLGQIALIKCLKTQDLLLLPSLKEGIANVVLEAMALGLPVVSADCGGMSEVVQPNKTGWLVPVRDPKAIAEAAIAIIESDIMSLNRVTHEAHRLVKEQFDYKTSINQFIHLYESVILDQSSKN